jgi:peroxiredoxin
VQVLGLAIQEGDGPIAKMRKFRNDHGLTYPLLHDEPGDIITKFGFEGIPQDVVINAKGTYVAAPDTIEKLTAALKKLVK